MANNKNNEAPTSPASQAPEAILPIAILRQQAEAVVAKIPMAERAWGTAEHARLITRLAVRAGLPKAAAPDFEKLMLEKGAGGNASQFRQWLAEKHNDLPALIPAKASRASLLADYE